MAGAEGIRAGRAYVELGANEAPLQKSLDSSASRLAAFGKAFQTIGGALALGFATSKITGFVRAFADSGREIFLMARAAGISTSELSELKAAVGSLGGDLEGTIGSMRKMGIFLYNAAEGGHEAVDALTRLGLSIADVAGLSELDKLQLIGERLAGIADLNTRQALGKQIFGREGGATVGLAAQLGGARAQARGSGQSDEDIRKAFALSQAYLALDRAKSGIGKTVGAAFAPAFTLAVNALTGAVKMVRDWIKANEELVQKIGLVGGAVAAIGATILTVGLLGKTAAIAWAGFTAVAGSMWALWKATSLTFWSIRLVTGALTVFRAVGTATMAAFATMKAVMAGTLATWSLFAAVSTAVTAPLTLIPTLIGAAVVGLAALGIYLFATSGKVKDWTAAFTAGLRRVVEVFNQAFAGIKDAIAAGDMSLAFKIAVAGLKVIWLDFDEWIGEQFGFTFTSMFGSMVTAFESATATIRAIFRFVIADLKAELSLLNTWWNLTPLGMVVNGINAINSLFASNDQQASGDGAAANAASAAQEQLADLNAQAKNRAAWAKAVAQMNAEQRGLPNGEDIARQMGARGTFEASAAFGFAGGNNPTARLEEQNGVIIATLKAMLEGIVKFAQPALS